MLVLPSVQFIQGTDRLTVMAIFLPEYVSVDQGDARSFIDASR
jgi:hypothetical protein